MKHGQSRVPWVNTAFDLATGHIAYVYFVDAHLVTRIDIHLVAPDAATTKVKVLYERTALSSLANDHVSELGRSDAQSGPEWQAQIESYLKKSSVAVAPAPEGGGRGADPAPKAATQ